MNAARWHSLRQAVLVALVIAVQVFLVLVVVASTLGFGHDAGPDGGPGRLTVPRPAPAGA